MSEPVLFHDVKVKKETEKALLVTIDGTDHWLPKSQIVEDETDVSVEGDTGTIALTEWICEQKKLI